MAALAACSSDSDVNTAQQEPSEGIYVVVDVFSGRPNPTFDLPADQAEDLRRQLSDIAESPTADLGPRPAGLGFRGFQLVTKAGEELGVVTEAGIWLADGSPHNDPESALYETLRQAALTNIPDFAELVPALGTS